MFSMKDLRNLKNLDKDDLLDLVGLQQKSAADWIVPTISAFSVGVLVGAGIGLLLAPKPGSELREDLRNRLQSAGDQAQETFSNAKQQIQEKASTPRSI